MFHKSATAAVTGLLAVAATLAVATGAANAVPAQPSPSGSAVAPADPADGMDAGVSTEGKGKGGNGKEKGKGGKGGKADEGKTVDPEVAATLDSALRDFLRPPNGGAEMGPLGKTSDEWLDLFLGPKPSPGGGTPKAKTVR
ncbi:hypothetical protein ABZ942_38000 [Nocardia sp. NPDC046473]|uniref:hypothetical protein n=1 Tax=Nocardia sp. NPDC046473 TaxID=3155733 RepID=UPI0033EDE0C0